MNYYRRHIGDALKSTARLSLMEKGALCELLDHYYANDGCQLVQGVDEACRLVRAIGEEERRAVERVLEIYFERRDDGYHQRRADREIAAAMVQIETSRRNGAKGGRPKSPRKPAGIPERKPVGIPDGIPVVVAGS